MKKRTFKKTELITEIIKLNKKLLKSEYDNQLCDYVEGEIINSNSCYMINGNTLYVLDYNDGQLKVFELE